MYGESNVRKVNLKTGAVVASMPNPSNDFGEGLTYYKGFLWQVIWLTRTIHQYDPITLKRMGTYSTPSELDYRDGWGLASTSDGMSRFYDKGSLPMNEKLYLTDSGTKLYQIEFNDDYFRLVRKVSVRTPSGTLLQMPNELELFDEDVLWANIFGKDCIAQINPESGKVIWMDSRRQPGAANEKFEQCVQWYCLRSQEQENICHRQTLELDVRGETCARYRYAQSRN